MKGGARYWKKGMLSPLDWSGEVALHSELPSYGAAICFPEPVTVLWLTGLKMSIT